MPNESPNVIAISYAKRALVAESRERLRMREYASVLGEYHVVVFAREEASIEAVQQEGGLSLYSTNAHSRMGMLFRAYQIGARILKANPGTPYVVSAQDPFFSGLVALCLSHFKNAHLHIQVHGDVFHSHFYKNPLVRIPMQFFASFVLARAEKIRVVSERIKRSLLNRGVKETRIVVVPIQSDLDTFLRVGEGRQYTPKEPFTFLYVGRFSEEKNLTGLIKAFAMAAKDTPVKLDLLGDGPKKTSLQAEAKRLGIESQVRFLPWSDDVATYFEHSDAFCLSSLHEGFAMVLVEAMAAGLPIVTTEVGCVGDWLIADETGLVSAPLDTKQYAAHMKELLSNPHLCERLGRAGHVTAKKRMLSHAEYLHAIRESFTL